MGADASSIRKLTADLRLAGSISRQKVRTAIRKTCADTARDAKMIVPVDTGALRTSIGYETKTTAAGMEGEVGPTQDYGLFVEMGTSRMGPQPYMRPAFDRRAPILQTIMDSLHIGEIQ